MPGPRYQVGMKLKIHVGDCESIVTIHARWHDTTKDTWVYRVNGKGSCGTCVDQVSEEYLMENATAI